MIFLLRRSVIPRGILLFLILVTTSVVGFALTRDAAEYNQVRDRYLERAKWHASAWQRVVSAKRKPTLQSFKGFAAAEVRYHRALELKYLQAAAHPWIPLKPDPPMPPFPAKEIAREFKRQLREIPKRTQPRQKESLPKPRERDII